MHIHVKDLSVTLNNKKILDGISCLIGENEQWAIIGLNGSGKTTLAHALANKLFYRGEIKFSPIENIHLALIEQHHKFKNKQNIEQFYHQQRFNSADAEDTLTVAEVLYQHNNQKLDYWIHYFGIKDLLPKPMIQLSNGENKRLQLINEMLKNPDLIILDNPFVGLDKSGREILKEALNKIAKDGKKIILICSEKDIPECITHIALLKEGRIIDSGEKQIVLGKNKYTPEDLMYKNKEGIKDIYTPQEADFEFAVRMQKINIQYSNKHILKNIDWEIRHGEKWCLSGPNGSGKSTLLSLITGDNPQAFANHIWLFDKKKGSGESIWDIKKKIGHVSPEIHLCFDKGSLVEDVVASGLYDTIGLFKKPSTNDLEIVSKWMSYLSIEKFRGKRLFNLSLGEQRSVMLSRALVKSPLLLILDEPCQGLDEDQTNKFNHLINEICKIENVTVIYVSHYQEEIPRNIENFLHLEKGERI
jgi:molybdate transport system ATP-binding protein